MSTVRLFIAATIYILGLSLFVACPDIARARGVLEDTPKPDGTPTSGIMGVVDLPFAQVRLYYEKGSVCVVNARRAEYSAPDKPTMQGCWALQPQGVVSAVFFDGALAIIPPHAIKQPPSL